MQKGFTYEVKELLGNTARHGTVLDEPGFFHGEVGGMILYASILGVPLENTSGGSFSTAQSTS